MYYYYTILYLLDLLGGLRDPERLAAPGVAHDLSGGLLNYHITTLLAIIQGIILN